MKKFYLNSSLTKDLGAWFDAHVPSLNDDAVDDLIRLMDAAYTEGGDSGHDAGYTDGYNDGYSDGKCNANDGGGN